MADLLDDPRLTAFGLLVETSSALLAGTGRQIEQHGLSTSEFDVLIRLGRSPGHRLRMTDLAAQAGLSASGLTRLVDRLSAARLLERQACPSDRRGSYAAITDAGLAIVERMLPGHLDLIEDQFSGVLTATELERFTRTLRKLRAVVRPGAEAGVEAAGLTG